MSYRTDNGASYDRTLLSSVPDPTRAEKQEGYNVDLLDDSRERRAPSPTNDDQHGSTTVGYSPGAVSYARKDESASNGHEPIVTRVPWYRTRRGILLIVALILVVIGAVVGGVVGGTHHSSKSSNTSGQQSTGNTTQQGQQSNGVGAAPSSTASNGAVGSNAAGPASSTASSSATATEAPNGLPLAPNPTSSEVSPSSSTRT